MSITTEQREELVEQCLQVQKNAFAPYSQFFVGAAILTKTGQTFVGCNVENASYGLAICAERGAVCSMVAAGVTEIEAIAVSSRGGVAPCGACRQVLAEFGLDFEVILVDSDSGTSRKSWNMRELLPGVFQFTPPAAQ